MISAQRSEHNEERPGEPLSNRLGLYSIKALVGSGGTGLVYRAHDLTQNRVVAIKICRAGFGPRFDHEAWVVASLNHPNICTLFDFGPDYLVMEFVDGETLAHRIAEGPMSPRDAVNVAMQIAQGLDAAHKAGVCHHDLSATNIRLGTDGLVKILDFGVSHEAIHAEQVNSVETRLHGTKRYATRFGALAHMSPEHTQGLAVDHRADLWSLGILLREMLTPRLPFNVAVDGATPMRRFERPPDAIIGIPPELQCVIDRCLECDREKRYACAETLGVELALCARNLQDSSAN